MPTWAQGLVAFIAVIGVLYLVLSFVLSEWLFLPKRPHELPYRQLAHRQGQMYVPQPHAKHRCQNDEEAVRGAIWICSCGRKYLNRDMGHNDRVMLRTSRRYWWRLRWWLPWHWQHLLTARHLTSSKYHLVGREGV